ncbi:hypothetical protein MKY14_09400 [Paenibacillus sp. FSL R5-0887]|uniref:hypothetical protein n=1 Tax=Paenibacillus sp. FSL R5-0887 TaxID=2921662 RepID=UPI0030F5C7C2
MKSPARKADDELMGYGLRVTGYGLRVTGYGLRVTGYGLRVTADELRTEMQLFVYFLPFRRSFGLESSYSM